MPNWSLNYSDEAKKFIKRLHPEYLDRVISKLELAASTNPYLYAKQLTGTLSNFHSIRVGKIRILVEIFEVPKIIYVETIDYRSDVYR